MATNPNQPPPAPREPSGSTPLRRLYSQPKVRTTALYERAKLDCVYNELDELWEGSSS